MDDVTFNALSANGKVAYGNLCAEQYALAKKPDEDWSPLFERLWKFTSARYWDKALENYIEILPECIEEFPDYESSDLSNTTEDEYDKLVVLYKGMPEEWNSLLCALELAISELGYSPADSEGLIHDAINEIEGILEKNGISLPSEDLISISPASENRGYGIPFDGRKVSLIIK